MELSVLQWNVGNFDVELRPLGGGYRGMRYTHASASRDEDLADLAALIRAQSPDLVTLQEVVVRSGHHARLAELAGYRLAVAGGPEDRHTQAILVKDRPGLSVSPGPAARGFNAVSVRLSLAGRELVAVSTHSAAGKFTAERVDQHRALAAWVKEVGLPMVVAGDFNFDDSHDSLHGDFRRLGRWLPFLGEVASADWEQDDAGLHALRTALTDLGARAGPTAGAPRLWPRILLPWGAPLIPLASLLGIGRRRSRLDYVWATPAVEAVEARVIPVTGPSSRPGAFPWMDHDPVLARISL